MTGNEQNQSNASQIPAEVLARARKSGADVPAPTWYAGRLEVDSQRVLERALGEGDWRLSDIDDVDHVDDADLAAIVQKHRPHPFRDTASNGMARMQRLLIALMQRLGARRTERRPV
jgi:hypothetical protein